jgi:hypothetical protein
MKSKNPRGAGRKPFSDPSTRRKQLAVNLSPALIEIIKADPRANSRIVEDAVKLYLNLNKS